LKLAIVGGGNTMMDAPFHDKEYEIWTTASVSKALPRVDIIFEFHDGNALQDKSVYEKAGEVITKKEYPIDEITYKYGEIFNSSMTMILAYAIEMDYTDIELYGIDNALDDEYAKYRPQFLYLLGYARGMGISVIVSAGSLLMSNVRRYGYERDFKQEKIEAMKKDYEAMKLKSEYMRGAIDAASMFAKL
jgi:hypothetical protein